MDISSLCVKKAIRNLAWGIKIPLWFLLPTDLCEIWVTLKIFCIGKFWWNKWFYILFHHHWVPGSNSWKSKETLHCINLNSQEMTTHQWRQVLIAQFSILTHCNIASLFCWFFISSPLLLKCKKKKHVMLKISTIHFCSFPVLFLSRFGKLTINRLIFWMNHCSLKSFND